MTSSLLDLHKFVADLITPERLSLYIRIILILAIGIPLIRFLRNLVGRLIRDKLSDQSEMLIKRFVYYVGVLILLVSVLNELGFKLSALLGAAGVFGIAIGFASQTSFANIISGIFLISEKPFVVGDIIQVGSTVGTVLSIDLLSIKLKTFDSRFVRIPNENMIKTEVINLTKFDVRRVDLTLSVGYGDDLNSVLQVLKEIALQEPLSLKVPEADVHVTQLAESGVNILFGVWGKAENYAALRTALLIAVREKFSAAGIEIPFPQVVIANEKPLPLRLEPDPDTKA